MMSEIDKAIADDVLAAPERVANLQCDIDEVRLWHVLRALLEWCDAQYPRIDFDVALEDVRTDSVSVPRADH